MRLFLFISILTLPFLLFSQEMKEDMELLKVQQEQKIQKEVAFKGMLKFYNSLVTDQILNDCIYEHSCSKFSQKAFDNYGFLKGLVMTCDRLMRCNRATLAETSKLQLTKKGRIKDHWDDYKKPH